MDISLPLSFILISKKMFLAVNTLGTTSEEKEAAKKLLELLELEMPRNALDRESIEICTPLIRLVEASLLEIKTNGGKLDHSIIGMLQSAANLADILDNTQNPMPSGPDNDERSDSARAEILSSLAHEIMDSGLVQLPVISRSRNLTR